MITRQMLRMRLATLQDELRHALGDDAPTIALETWSPGDGVTRYRVDAAPSMPAYPVLSHYVFGSGNAYDMLESAIGVLQFIRWEKEKKKRGY